MKKYILISSFAILGLTVSCSEDKNTTEETTTPETGTETAISPTEAPAGDAASQPVSIDGQPANVVSGQPTTTATPTANTAGLKLNPAHGEPGHRCEVAVGAPLPADGSAPAPSSAPQNIQMQSSGANTQPISPTPAPAPTSIMSSPAPSGAPATAGTTAPGMNPPHGEPGHDCAIPVGQPLKK